MGQTVAARLLRGHNDGGDGMSAVAKGLSGRYNALSSAWTDRQFVQPVAAQITWDNNITLAKLINTRSSVQRRR